MGMRMLSKPFEKSEYEWYRLKVPHVELVSRAGRKHLLERGDKFGVRDATSKKGVKRVIVMDLGKNIVFSMKDAVANHLMKKAVVVKASTKVESEMRPISFTPGQVSFTLKTLALACHYTFKDSFKAKLYISRFVLSWLGQQKQWHDKILMLQKATYRYYTSLKAPS